MGGGGWGWEEKRGRENKLGGGGNGEHLILNTNKNIGVGQVSISSLYVTLYFHFITLRHMVVSFHHFTSHCIFMSSLYVNHIRTTTSA